MLPLLQCLAHSPPLTPSRVARILAGEAGAACDELPEPVDAGEAWDEREEQARLAAAGGSYDEGDRPGGPPDRCFFRVYLGSSVENLHFAAGVPRATSLGACWFAMRARRPCMHPVCRFAFNREVPSRHLCLG